MLQSFIGAIKGFGELIVQNFGFINLSDFYYSMVHTKLLLFTLPTSFALFGVIEQWLGITPAMFISFGVMAVMELITGLWASRIKKIPWTSRKFSRFGLKILVWMSLIFVANSFKLSYENLKGVQNAAVYQLFYWIHGVTIVYVTLEYMISIMENLAKITGKKDNKLLAFLKRKLDQFLGEADKATIIPKTNELESPKVKQESPENPNVEVPVKIEDKPMDDFLIKIPDDYPDKEEVKNKENKPV